MSTTPLLRPKPGPVEFGILFALALVWGSSFVMIKLAIATIPAASTTAGRLILAAVIFLAITMISRERGRLATREWGWIAAAAALGNALPFLLISWGQEVVDAGIASILMAVMPLSTIIMAHVFTRDEKLNWRKGLGVSLGMVGLIVLVGPQNLGGLGDDIIRQLAILLAAISYAASAIVMKRLVHLPLNKLGAAVMSLSALMIVPVAVVFDQPWLLQPSMLSLVAVAVLGIAATAFGMILMFLLVRRQGASFFSQINFLVPPVGFFLAAWLLSERPGLNAYLALVIILISIAIARRGMGTR